MPEYLFQNPKTEEIRSVFMRMSETHEYYGTEDEQKVDKFPWQRIFTSPAAVVDGHFYLDANSAKDFVAATGKKKGTIGNIWDLSAELSEKRAQKEGVDPIKQKYFKNYSKKRRGRKHMATRPKVIEKNDITVEF